MFEGDSDVIGVEEEELLFPPSQETFNESETDGRRTCGLGTEKILQLLSGDTKEKKKNITIISMCKKLIILSITII